MKKIICGFLSFVFLLGFFSVADAAVNTVTPSTNDDNRTKGWAHVNLVDAETESVTLEFVSTRNFPSCFEYRTDGDTSQKTSDTNYNTDISDGLYPFVCQNNNSSTKKLEADEYVEVRMVFGSERDERFDWTRFDVAFDRTADITSPEAGEMVSGVVSFDAMLNDKDGDDNVQWAVRKGTCDMVASANIIGNVAGMNYPYDWDGYMFHAEADTATWDDGAYCFIFNPTEISGDLPIRETQEFVLNNTPEDKEECKKGGWENFYVPEFKNQGDCVSWLQSSEKAKGNKKDN